MWHGDPWPHSIAAWPVNGTGSSAVRRTRSAPRRDATAPVEIAGVDHRVQDVDYRSDPDALTAAFGPTLMAIAEAAAGRVRAIRSPTNPTAERLGYDPMSLHEGLGRLVSWLRELGKI